MNLSSMIKGALLALIFFGLMVSALPSRGQFVRLGGGVWFLMGQHIEQARAYGVANAQP
ncbi:hypothetical protein [Pseudomonas edaphica]|uniref:hypothetical protein n=1 Tax=Pseudomonas edaphica TaxID=2006980 RepID=UPI003D0E6508